MHSINSSGNDISGNQGFVSYSIGQAYYTNKEDTSHQLNEGIQQSQQENFDGENPTIACPGDINQNIDAGIAGAVVTFVNPVGTDNATGAITTQIAGPASGSVFPIGTTTVTFQVEDTSGNTATCSFDVTITGEGNPTISCPSDINQNVDTGVAGALVTFVNPVGTDNTTGAITTQIAGPASGSVFPIGTTTVTFQVEDTSGNIATCSFDVTITDDENPNISCPGDINQNVNPGVAGAVVTFVNPVGTDNATGAITTQIAGPASGSVFPIGTTTVTFQVEDISGNIATCSFDVTITDDENPNISCPGNINQNVDTGVAGAIVTFANPVGTDNATGAITTQIAGPASGSVFPIGTTTVTFQVEDISGNIATCSFDVTITDDENPNISCPGDINQNVDTGVAGAIVTFANPVGTDNATGAITTQIAGPASGSVFPIGTTTVTFQVEDISGNIATCSFDVTITDDENGGNPEDNDVPEDDLTTEINIIVFPNPTTDYVTLVSNGFNFDNNLNSYQLYNYQGKLISSSLINETNTTIDLSNLSTSIYLLQVFSQEKLFKTIKIVKK